MFNKMGSSNRKFKFKIFYFSLNYIQLPLREMALQLPGFSVAGFRDFTGSLWRHCEGPRQEASPGPLERMHLTAPLVAE